ncbi:putative glycosyl hydrolase [Xylaria venustula]|nr:putative glycosyl hydrolase [Xylaria venustula]
MGISKSKVMSKLAAEPQGTLDYTTSEAGNPFVEGWYAESGSAIYDGVFWIYATPSCAPEDQTYVDAISSPDLINWTKHPKVLTLTDVAWGTKALRSPTPVLRHGKYYLFFSANDIQEDDVEAVGGIGVAVAAKPEGPYVDVIGKPLIGALYNGAQPVDPEVFIDSGAEKGYLYYGGHSKMNVAILGENITSLGTFDDGTTFKEITPDGYTDSPRVIKRKGTYYLTWSEGHRSRSDYCISYATADNPLGPFTRLAQILQPDSAVANGTGHNSLIQVPGTDIWYILYHRQPLSETEEAHRVLAYDRMYFNTDGTIQPVTMLVKDNFTDGKMINWKTYGGEWGVQNQRLIVNKTGGGMAMLDTNFSDQVFDATVATTSGNGHPGLLFRVTELSAETHKYKGYKAAISPTGVITLGKAYLGKFTDLAQTKMDMVTGEEYHVRVTAIGSEISIFINDMEKPKITFTDGSFTTGANGVRVFNAAAKFGFVSVAKP